MLSATGLHSRLRNSYYGWRVVAASSFLSIFASSIFSSGFTVLFLPIQRELQLSRTAVSLVFSLARAEAGVGGPVVGWIVDRFDPRPIVLIGGLMAGVGLVVLSGLHSYWSFVGVYVGLVSVGHNTGFGQTLLAVVNRWFVRRKAVAMTILTTSTVIGGAVMVPILSQGVLHLGWRSVALYSGIYVALIVVPVSTLIRHSPENMGIPLEGGKEGDPRHSSRDNVQELRTDFSVGQALRTPTYWSLLWATTLRITITSGILVHIIPIMVWKGTSEQTGAYLAGLYFLLSIPLRLALGLSGARFPAHPVLAMCMLSGSVALLALAVISGSWVVYAFVAGIALVESGAPLNWIVVGNYFGRSHFAMLAGIINVFYNAGLVVSPLYLGWVYDSTESYVLALIPMAVLSMISAVLFAISREPKAPAPAPETI